ncbi:MAG: helix-turn-helix domain-containing protein [Candidatus Brocadiaceae bacterium]|nr:helix-turn-helix domain-containing protein [Candidatus Brocadiaceae bacterium]
MRKDEILYNIRETAKKLGGISRNTIMKEINEGKLKACWRGKRRFCTLAQINDYKDNQLIDMTITKVDFADYPEIDKVSV